MNRQLPHSPPDAFLVHFKNNALFIHEDGITSAEAEMSQLLQRIAQYNALMMSNSKNSFNYSIVRHSNTLSRLHSTIRLKHALLRCECFNMDRSQKSTLSVSCTLEFHFWVNPLWNNATQWRSTSSIRGRLPCCYDHSLFFNGILTIVTRVV